ncbi:MAG: site-2 protease family protein [Clostridiales bacterium]|nr:site-2 protease family protein [Clostridiales bacterium]
MTELQLLIYGLPGLVVAFTFHEYAHALVATWLGDPTPRRLGRLSLNPLVHIDWIGLLLLFLVRFGWAKPVPVNPGYFRHPRWGMLWVALAGPATNFVLAFLLAWLLVHLPWLQGGILLYMVRLAMIYNIALGAFNLIPIPPLDGSRILAAFLPEPMARAWDEFERYSWVLLLLLLLTGALRPFIGWVIGGLDSWILRAVGG